MEAAFNTFRVVDTSCVDTKRRLAAFALPSQTFHMGEKTPEAILCGERIAASMRAKKVTQAELARTMGWISSRLGNYIQGTRELAIRDARALAKELSVPPAYLLGVIDDLDRDVMSASAEQKRSILALLNIKPSGQPEAASAASEEAPRPIKRSGKSTRTARPRRSTGTT